MEHTQHKVFLAVAAALLLLALPCAQSQALPGNQRFAAIGPLPKQGGGYVNVLLAEINAAYAHGLGLYNSSLAPLSPFNSLFLGTTTTGSVANLGPFNNAQEIVFGIQTYTANPMTSGGLYLYTLYSGPKKNNQATDNAVHTSISQVDPNQYGYALGAGPYYKVCFEDRLIEQHDRNEAPGIPKDYDDFCIVANGVYLL